MLRPGVKLFDFQAEAVEKMADRMQMLLAIVMGGGKTVTTIAALEEMFARRDIKRALIVVPSGLRLQWQAEILKFTTRAALVIDGIPSVRRRLYADAHKFRYIIVSYESVRDDWRQPTVKNPNPNLKAALAVPFDCMVIDEATAIKTFTSQRAMAIKYLGKNVKARFALTGQPIENRPEDLFSIMEFVDKSVLGEPEVFDRTFIERDDYTGKMQHARNLPLLNRIMADVMIRKTRDDIKHLLPKVVEKLIPIEMSAAEAKLYNVIKDDLIERLMVAQSFGSQFSIGANYGFDEGNSMKAQGDVMAALLALRLVCDDASLLVHSAEEYANRPRKFGKVARVGVGSKYAWQLQQDGLLDRLPPSTKHKELRRLIDELMADPDNKVVIFSTFKGNLRTMQATMPRYGSVIYDGDMNARQKDAAKRQFKYDSSTRLFLSSDAGGYGVDIPEANYLISFDLPWSTGKFEQRESRIIRISSEFDHITLISMIMQGSVERRIWDMLSSKKGVAGAFLDGGYDSKGRYEITLSSLTDFLISSTV